MKNEWKYTTDESGVVVREVVFDSGKGAEPVDIVFMADAHFNSYTEKDLEDPVIASTVEYRKWNAGGRSVPNLMRCLDYAKRIGAAASCIAGDVPDFFSYGCLELMRDNIWNNYPDTLIALGNHDTSKKVQGKIPDTTPVPEKLEILQKYWNHDISYCSRKLGDKAMVIQMDNSSYYDFGYKGFFESQIPLLEEDIKTARAEGRLVFIFFHTPLSTENENCTFCDASMIGDTNSVRFNFYDVGIGSKKDEATATVYNLIRNNADVVAACVAGHVHSDFYTEIKATRSDGTDDVIPQYIIMGTPYGKGHVLRITVK